MGGAVIGIGQSGRQNQAADSAYEAIYDALNGQTGSAYFVVNGYGEALGPSANRDWSPNQGNNSAAEFVRSGGIFVDYCGWPMFWQVSTSGVQSQNGPAGFQQFVTGINYPWLDQKGFQTPVITTFTAPFYSVTQFPLTRGFNKLGSMDGVYLGSGTMVVPGGVLTIGGGSLPVATTSWTGLMALHFSGIGWYFYGTYTRAGFVGGPNAVPVGLYTAFILACLRGQASFNSAEGSGQITHAAYQAPAHSVSTQQPGPSSPYPGGSSSGSTSSGSASSGSGGVTVTTTSSGPGPNSSGSTSATTGFNVVAPASGPPIWEVAGLAAGAGLVTLGGYLLFKK